MKLEQRWMMSEDHMRRILRGLVLIAETKEESAMLDETFGDKVINGEGLIDRRELEIECRLADGYGEHYLYVNLLPIKERK